MPRSNVAEPTHSAGPRRLAEGPGTLSDDDVVRLSALALTRLEAAHDLANLLQVAGSAIRLIDRGLTEAARKTLDPIIGSALASIERATALSRDILQAGRPRTAVSSIVYLDSLLNEMRGEIALAAGPAVELVFHLGDYIPAIACRRGDIENVILNLVINARDAMREGGQLTLSVVRKSSDDDAVLDCPEVLLCVADTGCGMSPTVAGQAFKPFFTTKSNSRGTGLGLAMVRAFAGRLGGTAEIASVVGEGTTMMLRLPSCAG